MANQMVIIKTSVLSENKVIEYLMMKLHVEIISKSPENNYLEVFDPPILVDNDDDLMDPLVEDEDPWTGFKLKEEVCDWLKDNDIGKITIDGIEFENDADMLQFQLRWLDKW